MSLRKLLVLCLLSSVCVTPVTGGGPLIVREGEPGRWAGPIPYSIESGNLGSLSNAEASQLIRAAAEKWRSLATSQADFQELPPLAVDLNPDNIFDYFDGNPIGGGAPRKENPVVFDDDGGVVDLLLGEGAKETILGFAGPRFIDKTSKEFVSAFAVFNGTLSESPSFTRAVLHELGHLIGLDHTQANHALASNLIESDDGFVPVMYPFILPEGALEPARDDSAWVSWLQPQDGFAENTGSIRGRVLRRDGSSLAGANVVAVKVDGTGAEMPSEVVSVVSGYLVDNGGDFTLPGLQPGDYALFIEPLDPLFVDGSSVGPFESSVTAFPKDYYNAGAESGTAADDPTKKTLIHVQAGQTVSGISMVANEGNQPPIVNAGADQQVVAGASVTLQATASDPDGDSMVFTWRQLSGPTVALTSSNQKSTSFAAPVPASPVDLRFEFEADDGRLESFALVTVRVIPVPGNHSPVVEAGTDRVVVHSRPVTLAAVASDPDQDPLTVVWSQVSGPAVQLTETGALTATFLAPSLTQTRSLVFQANASDGKGGFASDTVSVQVIRNRAPAVQTDDLLTAQVGDDVVLHAVASDPDGDVVAVSWRQIAGPTVTLNDPDTDHASFLILDQHGSLRFDFEVEAGDGGFSTKAQVAVVVLSGESIVVPYSLVGFPHFADSFVGVAALNDTDQSNDLYARVIGGHGQVQLDQFLDRLPAEGQHAFLPDLLPAPTDASLVLRGSSPGLRGFYLVGNNSGTGLDGVGGVPDPSDVLFLPMAVSSDEVSTVVHVFNTDASQSALVHIRCLDEDGEAVAEADLEIAPSGTLLSTLGEIFADWEGIQGGYLELTSDGPRLLASQVVASDDNYAAYSSRPARETSRLMAPQFFTDGLGNSTRVRLVNVGRFPSRAVVTAFDDSGAGLGSRTYDIEPGKVVDEPVSRILASPPAGTLRIGYLEIQTTAAPTGPFAVPAQIMGNVIFSGNHGATEASLGLAEAASSSILFLQVAQSVELNIFQGLALLNTSAEDAMVTVRAFDAQGIETATVEVAVPPRGRRVDVLNGPVFFGAGFDQAGGHLRLDSNVPIFAFCLFGDFDQQYLAAVEGQSVEDD